MNIPKTYIAWHCRSCGFNHQSDMIVGSYPVSCPKCGERTVQHGHLVLPTNRVWRDENPQRYDLCLTKKEIQVYLRSLDGKQTGFTFDPDDVPDCDMDALDVAKDVLSRVEGYFYSSRLPKIREVVKSMDENHSQSEKNRILNRRNEIRRELIQLQREWDCLEVEE